MTKPDERDLRAFLREEHGSNRESSYTPSYSSEGYSSSYSESYSDGYSSGYSGGNYDDSDGGYYNHRRRGERVSRYRETRERKLSTQEIFKMIINYFFKLMMLGKRETEEVSLPSD